MVRTFEYPKKPQNTLKRYDSRGTYELGQIHTIVNTTPVINVAFPTTSDNPFPAVLPMIGFMGSYEYPSASIGEPLDCYIHGYVSLRVINLARNSEKGLPVTICATKVDGFVLALTPFNHSYNYRSAVLQGYAKPVESDEEKMWAMEQITNKVVPERWQNSRTPPDKAEMSSTGILKVTIETGSGKIRHGTAHNDAKDEKREDVVNSVWTGVIPIYETFDTPVPAPDNKVKDVPEYITSFVTQSTQDNRDAAREAVKE